MKQAIQDKERNTSRLTDITSCQSNVGRFPKSAISNIEKLLILTSLRTGVCYFNVGEIVGKLIGKKFEVFWKDLMQKKIETKVFFETIKEADC